MSKQKLTGWFPASVQPARPGIYQQYCGLGKDIGYQRWDGARWYSWCETPEEAERCEWAVYEGCEDIWRGLAQDPNKA